MNEKYKKIINLPHHVSPSRHPMPRLDRAAQFAPYSALSGYEDAVEETARPTDKKIEPDEGEIEKINEALKICLSSNAEITSEITYFRLDKRKAGGAYITTIGQIGRFDEINREITLTNGHSICIDDVIKIEIISSTESI